MSKTEITENSTQGITLDETGTSLAWLADAPLFIDRDQVAGFYDAVVRPAGEVPGDSRHKYLCPKAIESRQLAEG
jgi:hypothetical protein